jgi:hypothetical protein
MTTAPRLTEVPVPGSPADLAQRAADMADARRVGFSHLTAAAQRRIMETAPPEQVTELLAASPKFRTGDTVGVNSPKWPGRWQVEKVNPTTYLLAPEGGGQKLKAHHGMCSAAPEAGDAGPAASIGQPYVPIQFFNLGQIVRYLGTKTLAGIGPGGLGVIVGDNGGDKVKVAKLGGHPNGDLMHAARTNLRPVTPAELGL